jgi:sorbitol-6-phosphate 2-dehydrogenase
MKEQWTEIMPLLRGKLWNGSTAPLLRFLGDEKPDGTFHADKSLEKLPPADAPLPPCIHVETVGTWALGSDPDQLERNMGGAGERVLLPAKKERSDTVRHKVSVVTGGAQGFGKEIAEQLARDGSFVFLADMNYQGACGVADSLNNELGRTAAWGVEVNVSDEASVKNMVNTVVEKVGGIDLFINNAGVLKAGSVKEITFRDFSFVTSVNYIGYFLCVKHVSRVLALQHSGDSRGDYYTDIIQINSKSGLEGSNKNGAYAGGKFGGIGLTQSFALELIEDKVKVNSICPGNFFDGPLWSDPEKGLFVQYLNARKVPGARTIEDVKRFYEAKVPMGRGCGSEDVYKAILYCIEQKYETGQAVPVTGGQVMLN